MKVRSRGGGTRRASVEARRMPHCSFDKRSDQLSELGIETVKLLMRDELEARERDVTWPPPTGLQLALKLWRTEEKSRRQAASL